MLLRCQELHAVVQELQRSLDGARLREQALQDAQAALRAQLAEANGRLAEALARIGELERETDELALLLKEANVSASSPHRGYTDVA